MSTSDAGRIEDREVQPMTIAQPSAGVPADRPPHRRGEVPSR